MYKELIVNDAGFETRVALLENGVLSELVVERRGEADLVGNIYKARVMRVLPGMQAAFVDIGLKQAAFIYVDDVVTDFPSMEEHMQDIEETVDDHEPEEPPVLPYKTPHPNNGRDKVSIDEVLREGQEILVQVAKSPIGNKGARVTSRISLPGRFLVLMPTTDHIGVSRRILDPAERQRLKDGLLAKRRDPYGYIVRTACEGMDLERLSQEVDFLASLWKAIQNRFTRGSAASLLHQELTATLRAVRDLFTQEVDRLVIDSIEGYKQILDFVEPFNPKLVEAVDHYEGAEPIFDYYHLEAEISRLLRKKVWLKSGGYIVIEATEALVAVDVNTGRYVGKGDLSETILKTNLEAVKEIAYQLRLRDIGGIIVIDFIDMERPEDREKVYMALCEALGKDRSTTNVLPMSEMGLIQMTRKRTRENLNRMISEPCFYCEGEGRVLSRKTTCHNIYREILRHANDIQARRTSVKVHPEIAKFLLEEENVTVLSLERRIGREILIQEDPRLHIEQFDIVEIVHDSE
ncbi:MAG: ribonuclease E/G [Desulfatibacillaceae bacterium]